MVVQTIFITAVVLLAFRIGLAWGGATLAQSMAFVTLSASELARAYAARSERYSLWSIGIFSNRFMQYAVLGSLILLLSVVYVPVLQPIFNTTPLGLREWAVMLPLVLTPTIVTEITKWRWRRNSVRQQAPSSV
jgi:Ca2+-transporting ATPase